MSNPITHNGMRYAIGADGVIRENGLTINVHVLDAKSAYGRVRLLVTPLSGTGEVWVEADRCVLLEHSSPFVDSRATLEAAERAWARGDAS